jgi:transposase
MCKHYAPTLKAKVVFELLKDEKPMTRIASEHGIHPTQLRDWKKQAVDGLPELFAESTEAARAAAAQERKQEELYAEIGRLTTQAAWLKNLASNLPRAEQVALVDWLIICDACTALRFALSGTSCGGALAQRVAGASRRVRRGGCSAGVSSRPIATMKMHQRVQFGAARCRTSAVWITGEV